MNLTGTLPREYPDRLLTKEKANPQQKFFRSREDVQRYFLWH